jgi:acyl-coenzyme A thioesterase PaaI-like protein
MGVEVTYDRLCFGCGELNAEGLRMRFEPVDGTAVAEFEVPERYQSWEGRIHGGIVSLMLDEAVGWAAWHAGHPGVTAKLDVRLRLPLGIGERVRVVGRVERFRRNLVYASADIDRIADGARIADATATLMEASNAVVRD